MATREVATVSAVNDVASPIPSLQDMPLEDAVREKLKGSKELNMVILGRYYIGKSTLINSLFYRKGEKYVRRALEGSQLKATTKDVSAYTIEVDGVSFNIYDTCGLQDGDKSDAAYFVQIKAACPKVHLFVYCMKLDEPVRPEEIRALNNLTTAFGNNIWEIMVIALTFANQVIPVDPEEDENKYFERKFAEKKAAINDELRKLPIRPIILEGIKNRICPVGIAQKLTLPGIDDWRSAFWLMCLYACNEEAKGAVLKFAWKDPSFVNMIVGATVSTSSGAVGILAGTGSIAAGVTLCITGILLPVGITLIAGGGIASLIGIGATIGGVTGITEFKKKKNEQSQ